MAARALRVLGAKWEPACLKRHFGRVMLLTNCSRLRVLLPFQASTTNLPLVAMAPMKAMKAMKARLAALSRCGRRTSGFVRVSQDTVEAK